MPDRYRDIKQKLCKYAEQDGEKLYFEKVEGLTTPIDYATLKGCQELNHMQ